MAFRVRQTDESHRDLVDILEWLLDQQAGETGVRWFNGLQEAMESLSESPHRCPLAPEDMEADFEVRQLVYGRKPHFYRILFTIEEDTVAILHVHHGRRRRARLS